METEDNLADDYLAFIRIKDYADAKQFVIERITAPLGETTTYNSHFYQFMRNPFIANLNAEHEKRCKGKNLLWGIFVGIRLQLKFDKRLLLLQEALGSEVWKRLWLENRYDLQVTDAYLEEEAKKQIGNRDEYTEEQLALIYWWKVRESYRWEHVDPKTMTPVSSGKTGIVFLVDKKTGLEAPLLPGRKPFLEDN